MSKATLWERLHRDSRLASLHFAVEPLPQQEN